MRWNPPMTVRGTLWLSCLMSAVLVANAPSFLRAVPGDTEAVRTYHGDAVFVVDLAGRGPMDWLRADAAPTGTVLSLDTLRAAWSATDESRRDRVSRLASTLVFLHCLLTV